MKDKPILKHRIIRSVDVPTFCILQNNALAGGKHLNPYTIGQRLELVRFLHSCRR